MKDLTKHLSQDRIIGDLVSREKYQFANHSLIAEVVRDVMKIVKGGQK